MEYDDDWCQKMLQILEERTSINSETGCWEWQGTVANNGYGRVMIDRTLYQIHRLSAMIFHGFRPEYAGLSVLHKCNVRHCWNRDHLYVGTPAENMRDRFQGMTHCKSGHEFTPENTYIRMSSDGNPQRQCKTCNAVRSKEFKAKRKLREVG